LQGGRNNKKNPILREDEFMQRMKPRRQKPGAAAAGADLDPFAPEYGVDTWHEAGAKAAANTQAALASEKVGVPAGVQV
jgi:RNA-binding protein NOB1